MRFGLCQSAYSIPIAIRIHPCLLLGGIEITMLIPSSLSQLPAVPDLSPPQPSSVSSNSPVSTTSTPPPPDRPRPSRTHSRPPSSLSATHTDTSPLICGRRRSSSAVLWRSLVMCCVRASDTRWSALLRDSFRGFYTREGWCLLGMASMK